MSVSVEESKEYKITYNDETMVILFSGSLRLRDSEEYRPILDLLRKAYENLEDSNILLLDFSELKFMNSSGINTISRFVIEVRKKNAKGKLHVKGNSAIFWQKKSLVNLSRLWSEVNVTID